MRIGYPCINRTLGCSGDRTFRLKSYSPERLVETVSANLHCTRKMLEYNLAHGIGFFRLTSDLVPFASHPICTFPWAEHFRKELESIGAYALARGMRLAMHPDQFTLLNALEERIVENSVRELAYHVELLDAMKLPRDAKVQIHVGGVYGDKEASLRRFTARYAALPDSIRRRLVIENDDRLYTLADCLWLHRETGVPVLLDVFHHELNCSGEPLPEALDLAAATWKRADGPPIVDYSTQLKGERVGRHAETLDPRSFRAFLRASAGREFDLMLEIKDKERSALKALRLATQTGQGPGSVISLDKPGEKE